MQTVFIVRSHGGLGNQIFQLFYAILLKNRAGHARLVAVHDSSYKHRFEMDKNLEIAYCSKLGLIATFLSAVRIPKILSRLVGREIGNFGLLNYRFLDGYFQKVSYYKSFDDSEISVALRELKGHLVPKANECDGTAVLYHFRLLDFFKSEAEELAYVTNQFSDLPSRSNIISNNDKLFCRPEIQKYLIQNNIKYIESDGLSAIEVLSLMMKYGVINSNNSTLAFWAAIFNRCELNVDNQGLCKLYTVLSQNS